MRMAGFVVLIVAVLLLVTAGLRASHAPNVSYLVGTFLPGVVCLIVALKLMQTKQR
jgi:lipopolysaccharide export LptBFGC system permease protein LptF